MASSVQETASPGKSPLCSGRNTPLKHTHSPYGLPSALSDAERGVHAGFDSPNAPLSPAGSSGSLVSKPSNGGDRHLEEDGHPQPRSHRQATPKNIPLSAARGHTNSWGSSGDATTHALHHPGPLPPPPQYHGDYHHTHQPPTAAAPAPSHPHPQPMQYGSPPGYGMPTAPYMNPTGFNPMRDYDTASSTPILSRSGSGYGLVLQDPSGLKTPPRQPGQGQVGPPQFPLAPANWPQGPIQLPSPGLRPVQSEYPTGSGVSQQQQRSPQQNRRDAPPPPPLPPFAPSMMPPPPALLSQAKTLSECAGAPIKQGGSSQGTGNVRFVPLPVQAPPPPVPGLFGTQVFPMPSAQPPTPVLQSPPLQPKPQTLGSPPPTPPNEPNDGPRGESKRECRHFLSGKCTWGENCRFRHTTSHAGGSDASAPAVNGVILSPPMNATSVQGSANSMPFLSTLPPMSGGVSNPHRSVQYGSGQQVQPLNSTLTSPPNAATGPQHPQEVQVHYRQRSRPTSFSSSRPATPFSYPLTPNESFSNTNTVGVTVGVRPTTPQLPENLPTSVAAAMASDQPSAGTGVSAAQSKDLRSGRSTPNARYAHNPYTSSSSSATPQKSDASPANATGEASLATAAEGLSGTQAA